MKAVFDSLGGFARPCPPPQGLGGGTAVLLPGVVFLDAVSGERLYEGATASDAETPDVGNGLSNLPFGGPYNNRSLQIVRVDMSATYRWRDTTRSRDYGADVTVLRWGHSWRFSRPYVGIPSPDWASPDLFIDNGGTSDWNAIIDSGIGANDFENAVYCRVRNIGPITADNDANPHTCCWLPA